MTARAVLIVEDERIVARDLQQTLGEMGYDAYDIAASMDEAIACADRRLPDLVLMDIRIKGAADGVQAAAAIRARYGVGVIYLTAHADEAMVERAKKTEPYGYLLKPVKAAELRSMIEIALYRRDLDVARARAGALESDLARQAGALALSNARFKALTDLNMQLASERDPHSLLKKVCDGARVLMDARYAVLAVNDKASDGAVFSTSSGIDANGSADSLAPPPLDRGPLGQVYTDARPWRASGDAVGVPADVLPPGYPAASAWLAAPVSSLTRTYGWLCLADRQGAAAFTDEDERILGMLAGQVGRIYENGSLYQQVQRHAAQLQREMDERERAAAELRLSEERFRELAESINDVFFVMTADYGELAYVSPAYEQIWGRPYERGRTLGWFQGIHADDRTAVLARLKAHGARPVAESFEFRIVRPDGAVRWILARHFPLFDADGNALRVVGVATDITDRKLADAKIRGLNRVYSVLSGINALLVRARDREELFTDACNLAVEHGNFQLAWIGLVRDDAGAVTPVAWAGDATLTQLLRDCASLPLESSAFLARAIEERQPAFCNDLATEGRPLAFGTEMGARGIGSVVTLPLVIEGRTIGCLTLATSEKGSFDEAEMRLLVELAADISFALDHIEKADRLNYLAYYDALTGLANRPLFIERLAQSVSAARVGGGQFAVAILDPERFETINETYGRIQGDMLLRDVAARMTEDLGDQHAVARSGPGEFAVVIPFAGDVDTAGSVVDERYQAWFGRPFQVNGDAVSLAARAGIALFPLDGYDAETLLKNAEAALKRAHATNERSVFFTPEISQRIAERLSMETRLRRALANNEFVLHYQPKVDLETREIVGIEALIRWNSPELGLVPPGRFIPLMEETGMIIEVGTWVLHKACRDRIAWQELDLRVPRIAVNVSTKQLHRTDFVGIVRNALKLGTRNALIFGGPAAGIDIEVTESLLVENAESNIAKLHAIRELGIGIALDDFGTGYSSLGYLARMPVDSLKIDRSFTSAMLEDPSVMTLVSTMITLAHALRLRVVAEGVESEEQAKILRLLRCDEMQGYLISRPVNFDDMKALLPPARA